MAKTTRVCLFALLLSTSACVFPASSGKDGFVSWENQCDQDLYYYDGLTADDAVKGFVALGQNLDPDEGPFLSSIRPNATMVANVHVNYGEFYFAYSTDPLDPRPQVVQVSEEWTTRKSGATFAADCLTMGSVVELP